MQHPLILARLALMCVLIGCHDTFGLGSGPPIAWAAADHHSTPGGSSPARADDAQVPETTNGTRPERLVVATFEEQGVTPGLGDIVADIVTQSIDTIRVQLVERRQVRRVLDEQIIATSDLTRPGGAIRYGRLADSRLVLLGTVYRVDGLYVVSARIVDIESGIVREDGRAVAQFRTVDEMLAQIPELVRALRLCDTCPATRVLSPDLHDAYSTSQPDATVRDYLERPGRPSGGQVTITSDGGARTLKVGDELGLRVTSERDGYLSLLVVDSSGAVSMLVPNALVRSMPIRANTTVSIPADAGFKLRVRPPLGTTRLKAIVSREPIALAGSPEAAGMLYRVSLNQPMAAAGRGDDPSVRSDWIGAELELLVVSEESVREPVEAPLNVPLESAPALIASAIDMAQLDHRALTAAQLRYLHWPLLSPFAGGIDLGCRQTAPARPGATGPRVAVIDADFDPDDPVLAKSLQGLEPAMREQLRNEIRRNGPAGARHGNRVASLIAGEAPWLPSLSPGAEVLPIRVTTTLDGPSYRVDRGGASELIAALRLALNEGCKVINLSLSVDLKPAELSSFINDPIWDELERAGVLVVCAAGNSGADLDSAPSYPACIDRPNIMCVGAVGPDGNLARWTGGGSCTGAGAVDILAPGGFVCVSDGADRIAIGHGTSYAAAIASGVAANLLRHEPSLSPQEVIRRLVAGARRIPKLQGACRSGIIQCVP